MRGSTISAANARPAAEISVIFSGVLGLAYQIDEHTIRTRYSARQLPEERKSRVNVNAFAHVRVYESAVRFRFVEVFPILAEPCTADRTCPKNRGRVPDPSLENRPE